MLFRWIIKQPRKQKFWNLRCHYQDIYDWISPIKKEVVPMVYSSSTVYWGKWVWYIHSIPYSHFFEALNNAFEMQLFFSGLTFLHHITDTDMTTYDHVWPCSWDVFFLSHSIVLVDWNDLSSIFWEVHHSHSRHQKTTSNLLRINVKGKLRFNHSWPLEGIVCITLW